jgi:hypothetical protein
MPYNFSYIWNLGKVEFTERTLVNRCREGGEIGRSKSKSIKNSYTR